MLGGFIDYMGYTVRLNRSMLPSFRRNVDEKFKRARVQKPLFCGKATSSYLQTLRGELVARNKRHRALRLLAIAAFAVSITAAFAYLLTTDTLVFIFNK